MWANSAIVWRGVSRLDGRTPIALVLTGLAKFSANRKTGGMVQSYILVDGQTPRDAIHTGADAAICGDCAMRGDGTGKDRRCYVSLRTGLGSVGRHMAGYPVMSVKDAANALQGRSLRMGTYGDPTAIPIAVWRALLQTCRRHTGYTHQWKRFSSFRAIVMASADSEADRDLAKSRGWRTFRVRRVSAQGIEPLLPREIVCPASKESTTPGITCWECGLCSGAGPQKDIAIIDHSTQAGAVIKRLTVIQ